ncbi:putative aflatoxin biosynthesis ketoreductase nor-1 protein [Diplogelasinospora grovesii]|uniref:Aflatoxin biosynthesis ketoreductase nor-1 protein n=1 Tax=Diplogelasinospora grovesii TaxID=303347 RepID=A0AAN6RZG6_9PEZI|nr:putative aflatoxin biosynthesis ketoreductase nor-1 protein [Diplogelasinospora grovesii]
MSSEPTTVLITGANRGIGRGLAEAYLARPNHIVMAAVRNPDTTTLKDYKPAAGSKLLLVKMENTSAVDPDSAVAQMRAANIAALDVVVANAGINPVHAFAKVNDINTDVLRELFEVNTVSFVPLFRAMYPLLKAAADKNGAGAGGPKLLAVSSNAGQIVDMEAMAAAPVGAYGSTKTALNYLVRRAHFENPWLTAFLVNPGFVQTDNGNATARAFGMSQAPPQTIKESVAGLMKKLDGATREETSGNWYNYDGTPMTF